MFEVCSDAMRATQEQQLADKGGGRQIWGRREGGAATGSGRKPLSWEVNQGYSVTPINVHLVFLQLVIAGAVLVEFMLSTRYFPVRSWVVFLSAPPLKTFHFPRKAGPPRIVFSQIRAQS